MRNTNQWFMSYKFRFIFMRIVAIVFATYTIIWGLAPYVWINFPARLLIDILDWPLGNMNEPLDRNTKWLSAIGAWLLGAISVFLWNVVAPALKKGDKGIAKTTLIAFVVWYIIDWIGSIAAGVTSNVFFNTLYIILVIVPLVWIPESK